MKSSLIALAPFCFATLAGCGGSTDTTDTDPEPQDPQPTITQGVYGVLVAGCDTSDCDSKRIVGQEVHVLAEAPDPMTGEAGAPLASGVSDDIGMYQIEIQPGDYFLYMHPAVSWSGVTVGQGLVRCDWVSGPGGGIWQCGAP